MYIKKISKFAVVAALMGSMASEQLYGNDYEYETPAQPDQITGTPVAPSFTTVARSTVETELVADDSLAAIRQVASNINTTEIINIVRNFYPSTVTVATLKKRTLTQNETAVLEQLAVTQPSVVANLAFKYFQQKANLGLSSEAEVMPEALVKILKAKPAATAALVKNGGFMDFTKEQPTDDAIPQQVISLMAEMDEDNIAEVMEVFQNSLPKGQDGEAAENALLPVKLREFQVAKESY